MAFHHAHHKFVVIANWTTFHSRFKQTLTFKTRLFLVRRLYSLSIFDRLILHRCHGRSCICIWDRHRYLWVICSFKCSRNTFSVVLDIHYHGVLHITVILVFIPMSTDSINFFWSFWWTLSCMNTLLFVIFLSFPFISFFHNSGSLFGLLLNAFFVSIEGNFQSIKFFLLFTSKLHTLIFKQAAYYRGKRVSDRMLHVFKLLFDRIKSLQYTVLGQNIIWYLALSRLKKSFHVLSEWFHMLVYPFLDNLASLRVLLTFRFDFHHKSFVEFFYLLVDFIKFLFEFIMIKIKLWLFEKAEQVYSKSLAISFILICFRWVLLKLLWAWVIRGIIQDVTFLITLC